MLLVFHKQIRWYKENRTPQGSVKRKQYLKPVLLDSVPQISDASDNDVYFVERFYMQKGSEMIEEKRNSGFCSADEFTIPCITIIKDGDSYRIRWFDDESGNVRRRGGNEDYGKKGAPLAKYPNRLNETAFVLEPEKSGIVRWNNRYTSYHGQWYLQDQVYFVNTDTIDADVFIRDYDHDYQQLADLF